MSILELQDLYQESIVRELIEKTKSAAITWVHLGGTQFKATQVETSACTDPVVADITWEMYITKSQIGSVSFKYVLDVKKDSISQTTISDGPLPTTARDSVVKDLYEIVEILVLQLDLQLKGAIRFIQNLEPA